MNSDFELPPPLRPPPLPASIEADAEFTEPVSDSPVRACPNCGAPVHGPFCYACGQSEKGMIRHLSEVMSDLADIVFNVDSRIFRSLGDLYFRPGYLTTEYLAGRRARYVTPFRLFFFLTIIAFFAIQSAIPEDVIHLDENSLELAETPEQVTQRVDAAIAEMTAVRNAPGLPSKAVAGIDKGMQDLRDRGAERIREIEAETLARSADGSPAAAKPRKSALFELNGKPWDATSNPVRITWLTDGINARINHTFERMQANIDSARKDPRRLLAGWFAVLPQTLFVLMPLFAVLLKVCYLFKRRLYMEHLLVALHSHAFIFMSVLVILALGLLDGLVETQSWLSTLFGWLSALAWIWLFLYLFLMQKRVYGQSWIMTFIKYGVVGISYSVILLLALVLAGLVSLALT